jgi:hypothetical protein
MNGIKFPQGISAVENNFLQQAIFINKGTE